MDQNQNGQPGKGIVGSASAQEARGKKQYESYPMIPPSTNPPIQMVGPSAPSSYPGDYALQCMDPHQQQEVQLQEKLKSFWAKQQQEIEENTDSKTPSVPLSRIKKIMKSDPDVRLVSAESTAVFAKACELFIMELTLKAWANAEDNHRRTLKKSDIAAAISKTDVFDFLEDIVPTKDGTDKTVNRFLAATAPTPAPAEAVPYSCVPPPQHVASPAPPFAAPPTLHQLPHGPQTYPPIPDPTGPIPNEENPSPNLDD